MKKTKKIIFSYLLSLGFGVFCYFMTYNLYIAIIYAFINFLLFQLFILPLVIKNKKELTTLEEFQHFVSSLIMQLTITPSLMEALENVSNFFDDEIQETMKDDELALNSKIEILGKRFPFPLFFVFAKLLDLYTNQGGDIIEMTVEIISQIDHMEVSLKDIILDNKKKISEIFVLWGLSIASTIYLKTILFSYYLDMLDSIFIVVVIVYLLLISSTIFMAGNRYLRNKI